MARRGGGLAARGRDRLDDQGFRVGFGLRRRWPGEFRVLLCLRGVRHRL
nr:hypothetical protein [Kibdelosporangium sp. MJ126-NF4]